MSKRLLGGITDCEYKTSSWHLNGLPMVVTLGQQYYVGDKPTVILYTYINYHTGTPGKHQKQKQCSASSNMVVIIYCYICCKDKATTWHLNGFPDCSILGQQYKSGRTPPLYCTLIYIFIAMQSHQNSKT